MTQLPGSQDPPDGAPRVPAGPEPDTAAVDDRYRRVVRRARLRRLIPLLCLGVALYLPATKGEVRFLGLDHLSWLDAVEKTLVWVVVMGVCWLLPVEWNAAPSGYQGLSGHDRAAVDTALDTLSPPEDPVVRRVADEYAKRVMRAGEPGRQHAIGLGLAAVAACALATQWWALVLWLGVLAYGARNIWRRRGLATQAERYLTAPRRFLGGETIVEMFKDAPSIDSAAFRRDMDELADQESLPRRDRP